jgi:hypothetical protein
LSQARLKLHLCIAEIHDGLWALRCWMPDGQIPSNPTEAAAAINMALSARGRREPATFQAGAGADHRPSATRSEAAWLVQVARAYQRIADRNGATEHERTPTGR